MHPFKYQLDFFKCLNRRPRSLSHRWTSPMIHKLKLDLGVYTPLNRQPGTQRVIRKKSAGEYRRRESRYINSMRKRVNKFISGHNRSNCLPCLKANFPEDHRLNHHLCWVTWSFHAVHNAQSAHLWRKSHSSLVCSRSI